jgi:hypothetical protein
MDISKALLKIEGFKGSSLKTKLSELEAMVVGIRMRNSDSFYAEQGLDTALMLSARRLKAAAAQIDEVIHSVGILQSLQHILEYDEQVEYVSFGAGNTGKKFDLETNKRMAEFKFIDWQPKSNTIRENGIFKDFYSLAEHDTNKKKELYVIGTNHVLKFLNGGRALNSVLSKQPKILAGIISKYSGSLKVVRNYYEIHQNNVEIHDVSKIIVLSGSVIDIANI